MSRDGGGVREFEEHWDFWRRPRRRGGGWLEARTHPQVAPSAPCPFWYHPATGRYAFERPPDAEEIEEGDAVYEPWSPPPLQNESPVWKLSINDLKAVLRQEGEAERRGITTEDLARRAVYEYEKWTPRVQSWHDYQHHTFWFLGNSGDKKSGSFDPKKGFSRDTFADDAFYRALAAVATERLQWMHPVSIAYLTWTFSRPGVVVPQFLTAVGDHLVDGKVPMMDRCGLCTLIWCYWKLKRPHQAFLAAAAEELKRPTRLRSLAPRNLQNSMIGYSRVRFKDPELVDRLARGIRWLCDAHDPRFSKHKPDVLFSYTCLDGSEVPADTFRINGLAVILRAFNDYRAKGPRVERAMVAMADYTRRSMERSPKMMRSPGDAAEFVAALALASREMQPLREQVESFLVDWPAVVQGAPGHLVGRLQRALADASFEVPASARA